MSGKLADYVTVKEAAQRLSVTARNIRQIIERGDLRAVKVGRDWLIERADLEKYVESRR